MPQEWDDWIHWFYVEGGYKGTPQMIETKTPMSVGSTSCGPKASTVPPPGLERRKDWIRQGQVAGIRPGSEGVFTKKTVGQHLKEVGKDDLVMRGEISKGPFTRLGKAPTHFDSYDSASFQEGHEGPLTACEGRRRRRVNLKGYGYRMITGDVKQAVRKEQAALTISHVAYCHIPSISASERSSPGSDEGIEV